MACNCCKNLENRRAHLDSFYFASVCLVLLLSTTLDTFDTILKYKTHFGRLSTKLCLFDLYLFA